MAKKKPTKKVVYPDVEIFDCRGEDVLVEQRAKDLLGWTEETDKISFGSDFLLKDVEGKKIRCYNNLKNRPFSIALATEWKLQILKGKWCYNGESMIIDRLGQCQDCQHRLVGLVLACQEFRKDPNKWPYWSDDPTMDALIVVGISEADNVVNTINTGKPRTLSDVIYRSTYFSDLPSKNRFNISKSCAFCMKLLWERTGWADNAFINKRAHSDYIDYIQLHPRILECVRHCWGEQESLKTLIPTAYASAMLYLMGSSATDPEEYDGTGETLDWKLWDEACDFWVRLSSGDKKLVVLKKRLTEASYLTGASYKNEVCALAAKAWAFMIDEKDITSKNLVLKHKEDELGRPVLLEAPTVGGIDKGGVAQPEDAEV